MAETYDNPRARVLAKTLDEATGKFLDENKSPSRKVGELDNRGSHFYLAFYWAQALAAQDQDAELKTIFTGLAKALQENEAKIIEELANVQGHAVEIGGYYRPEIDKVSRAMRPSDTLNTVLATLARQ